MKCLILDQELINQLSIIHNNKYTYIKKEGSYLYIVCPIHGEFKQRMDHHKKGHDCKKCSAIKAGKLLLRSIEEIIEEAKEIHKDKNYDYSLNTKDLKAKDKMSIICPIHGLFKQCYDHHLRYGGCPKCSQKRGDDLKRKTTPIFIEESNIVHNNRYIYTKVDYIQNKQKVCITCPIHR